MESGGFGRFRPRGSNPCARTSKPLKSFIAVRGSRTRTDSRARQRWASQIVVLFCSTRRIGSVPVGLQSTPSADDRFLTLYVRSQGGSRRAAQGRFDPFAKSLGNARSLRIAVVELGIRLPRPPKAIRTDQPCRGGFRAQVFEGDHRIDT